MSHTMNLLNVYLNLPVRCSLKASLILDRKAMMGSSKLLLKGYPAKQRTIVSPKKILFSVWEDCRIVERSVK